MSEVNIQSTNRLAIILGLAMALGPLTALSLGSKFASDETLARAQAGAVNMQTRDVFAPYVAGAMPDYAAGLSVGDIVHGAAVFRTFEQALTAAGANALMEGDQTYTVFAPTEEAFNALSPEQRAELINDKDALAAVVARHIVPGRISSTDLLATTELTTIGGETIQTGRAAMIGGNIGVGGASLVQGNLQAANGVVHVIDRVIN